MTTRKSEPRPVSDLLRPAEPEIEMRAIIATTVTQMAKAEDQANAIEIRTEADLQLAAETVSLAQKLGKGLEAQRLKLTKPLLEQKQMIDQRFKELTDRLKGIQAAVVKKIEAYKTEERRRIQEETRRQEEQREQERLAALLEAEAAKEETGLEIPPEMLQEELELPIQPEQPAKRIETPTGGVQERKLWRWRLVDIDKVPDRFFELNETLVNKAVREGAREIPGIEIYQETITVPI